MVLWRVTFIGEFLLVGTLFLLGLGWPSLYTIALLLVLPAFVVLAFAGVAPQLLLARHWLRYYGHLSAVLSALCWASVFAWTWSNTAEKEIHLLPNQFTGDVMILFDVRDGEAPRTEDGRRIYEIPASGILRSRFSPNKQIRRSDTREFFYVGLAGERVPIRDSGSVVVREVSGGVQQDYSNTPQGCNVPFEAYVVTREPGAEKARAGENVVQYLREHPVDCSR